MYAIQVKNIEMEIKYINTGMKGEDFDCNCEDCKYANCYNFRIHYQKLNNLKQKYTEILGEKVLTTAQELVDAREKFKQAKTTYDNLGFKKYKSIR